MPYLYAHALHGLTARERFPKAAYEITGAHLDAFILGLYGPDVYFGDRLPPPLVGKNAKPVGNALHALPGNRVFAEVFALVGPDDRAFSYALGLLCHLSLDNTMHPYIESQHRGLDHTRFEMRQDLLIRNRSDLPRMQLSPNALYDCAGAVRVADALMTSLVCELTGRCKPGIYRRSFYKWQRMQAIVYDPKGTKRKLLRGVERLLGRKKGVFSGLLLTVNPEETEDLFNLAHRPWRAPWAMDTERTESYFDLFDRAVEDAAKLAAAAVSERAYGLYDEVLERIGTRNMDGTNAD